MPDRPNIVIITMDQLRWDALGCAGNPVVQTPNIDRLAREGARCEHFFVQSPVCQPSRATMFTGRYPRAHGVKWNWHNLPDRESTIAGTLSGAGYHTHAIGKTHFTPLDKLHGFDDRFFVEGKMYSEYDEYRTRLRERGLDGAYFEHTRQWGNPENYGASTFPLGDDNYVDTYIGRNARRIISADDRAPFFYWVSFCNPHMPFDPPEPFDSMYPPESVDVPPDFPHIQHSRIPEFRTSSGQRDFSALTEQKLRKVIANYYGCISLVDREIGGVLDALESRGVLDDTVIIFLSDHGEMLGHKGRLWKGRMLYDHLVRVPFILRYPREIGGGQIISDLIQATDIMPTILDYAGVSGAPGIQGRSIRRLLRKDSVDWRQWAFAEAGGVKMARTHTWKLIHYAGRSYGELFNLEADPLELENLYDRPEYAPKRAEMAQLLLNILIETEDPLPEAALGTPYEGIAGDHPQQEYGGRDRESYLH